MRTAPILIAMSVLSLLGCAAQRTAGPPPAAPPRQYEGPPPAAPDAGTPAAPTMSINLQMDMPAGWAQVPAENVPPGMSGMMVHAASRSMIMVMAQPSPALDMSAVVELARGELTASGSVCAPATVAADGLSGSFTFANSTARGKVAIRRMTVGESRFDVAFMGMSPPPAEADMAAALDAVAASARISATPATAPSPSTAAPIIR